MKQVFKDLKQPSARLIDVPAPRVGPGEVLVSTKASLISAGLEKISATQMGAHQRNLIEKISKKVINQAIRQPGNNFFSALDTPIPLGYSAAGDVIAVGRGLEEKFKIGDRVAMVGHAGAQHAEVNVVSQNLVTKIPNEVQDHQACFAALAAEALHAVRCADVGIGDRVLVLGAGMLGQLVAQLVKNAGGYCFVVDDDPIRLDIAKQCGAQFTQHLNLGDLNAFVQKFTKGRGFDAVMICTATNSDFPLKKATQFARDRACIVMVGKSGTVLPHAQFLKKELRFVASRGYGPGYNDPNVEKKGQHYPLGYVRWTGTRNVEEILDLMARKQLDVSPLISQTFPIEKAVEAYETVSGDSPCLGVVLTYPRPVEERLEGHFNVKPIDILPENSVGISMIGTGTFSQKIALPVFRKLAGVHLVGILSKSGICAKTIGAHFGFNYVARDEEQLFIDEITQAVAITTRHENHAELICEALQAKKHVFVTNPLGRDEDEIDAVEEIYQQGKHALMVGFNRRYAPFTMALKDKFKDIAGARQMMIRVNAGRLDDDSWQRDLDIGGGRLLGEVSHFIDLALALVDSRVEDIYAVSGQGQDVFTIIMNHADGSLSTICYTSEGDTGFSQEYIELYAGGQVGVIDNFTRAKIIKEGKETQFSVKGHWWRASQDKGHNNMLMHFIAAIKGEADMPCVETMFQSNRLALLAQKSLREGVPLKAVF